MAYAIVLNDKKNKVRQVVGRVWAASQADANNLACLFHPCKEDQELELRPAE